MVFGFGEYIFRKVPYRYCDGNSFLKAKYHDSGSRTHFHNGIVMVPPLESDRSHVFLCERTVNWCSRTPGGHFNLETKKRPPVGFLEKNAYELVIFVWV